MSQHLVSRLCRALGVSRAVAETIAALALGECRE